jgi:hypothetical protein
MSRGEKEKSNRFSTKSSHKSIWNVCLDAMRLYKTKNIPVNVFRYNQIGRTRTSLLSVYVSICVTPSFSLSFLGSHRDFIEITTPGIGN